jgi:tyrosine-protein phosphatase YwqE
LYILVRNDRQTLPLLLYIDDGSKSWKESLDMIRIAVDDGIKGAVTIPHWIQGTNWQPTPERVRSAVA